MARLGSLLLKHPSKCPSEPVRERHQSQRAGNCGEITANKAEFIKKLLLTGIIIICFHCFVPKICIFKPISSWDHLRSLAKLTPSVKNGINFRAVNPKGPDNPRIPKLPALREVVGFPKVGQGAVEGWPRVVTQLPHCTTSALPAGPGTQHQPSFVLRCLKNSLEQCFMEKLVFVALFFPF